MPINFPRTTFQILRAQQIQESVDQRVLIVGQKENAGTAVSGALVENAPSATNEIASLFGARSIVAEMVREFRRPYLAAGAPGRMSTAWRSTFW